MLNHWLRRLLGPTHVACRSARSPSRRRLRLGVEPLETRLTPTTVTLSLNPSTVVEGGQTTARAYAQDGGGNLVLVGQMLFSAFGQSKADRLEFTNGVLEEPIHVQDNVGWHTVFAGFSQGGADLPDASTIQRVDVLGSTNARAVAPAAPLTLGQDGQLQGVVLPVFAGEPAPVNGMLTFFVDGVNVGSAPVDATGQATLDYMPTFGGTHQFQVQYQGTDNPDPQVNFASSDMSPAVSFTVTQNFATNTLTASSNPAVLGQPVTFTAAVLGPTGSAAPTGSVMFDIDGTTVTAPLVGGTATYTTSSLALGAHQVSAIYSGDLHYPPEVSNSLTETVIPATAVSLNVSALTSTFGQPITLTATISANPAQPVVGRFSFFDGNQIVNEVSLLSGGNQISFTWDFATPGPHQFSVHFNGGGLFGDSSSATIPANVLLKSHTTLTLSPSPAAGQPLTLTTTVNGDPVLGQAPQTPAGTVTLLDNGMQVAMLPLDNGQATFTVPVLAAGTHNYQALYSGDTTFAGSSVQVLGVTVLPPPIPVAPTALSPSTVMDVSGMVRILRVRHRRRANPLQQTLLLQNVGGVDLQGPLHLVLDGLGKVKLRNATGFTQAHATPGDPYVKLPVDVLAAGKSVLVNLQFNSRRNMPVSFNTLVLAGPGAL
jgi:hypothetical protein